MVSGGWRHGYAIGVGLAAASFVLAITFGAFATRSGVPPLAVVVMSALTFSGSAQFAYVTAIATGGGLMAAVGSAAVVNLRFIPMATSCIPALRGGRLRRAAEAQLVVDGSWAAAQGAEPGCVSRAILIPATLVQWPAWIAGTALGAYGSPGPAVADRFGLDVVFPAFFAVLVFDVARRRSEVRPILGLSSLLTLGLLWLVPTGVAVLAGCVPALMTRVIQECR